MPTAQTPDSVGVLNGQLERIQSDTNSIKTPYVVLTDRYGQRVAPVAQTVVAFTSPPTSLSASSNTAVNLTSLETFGFAGRRIVIQNITDDSSSPVNIYVNFDSPASMGSWRVKPGEMLSLDVPVETSVNFWNPSSSPIPLNSAGGIILGVWL